MARLTSAELYDTLILAMCYNLELERILDNLDEMQKKGITPTRASYIAVLELALKFEDASTAMFILSELESHNMISEEDQTIYLKVLRCAAITEEVSDSDDDTETSKSSNFAYMCHHLAVKYRPPLLGKRCKGIQADARPWNVNIPHAVIC